MSCFSVSSRASSWAVSDVPRVPHPERKARSAARYTLHTMLSLSIELLHSAPALATRAESRRAARHRRHHPARRPSRWAAVKRPRVVHLRVVRQRARPVQASALRQHEREIDSLRSQQQQLRRQSGQARDCPDWRRAGRRGARGEPLRPRGPQLLLEMQEVRARLGRATRARWRDRDAATPFRRRPSSPIGTISPRRDYILRRLPLALPPQLPRQRGRRARRRGARRRRRWPRRRRRAGEALVRSPPSWPRRVAAPRQPRERGRRRSASSREEGRVLVSHTLLHHIRRRRRLDWLDSGLRESDHVPDAHRGDASLGRGGSSGR